MRNHCGLVFWKTGNYEFHSSQAKIFDFFMLFRTLGAFWKWKLFRDISLVQNKVVIHRVNDNTVIHFLFPLYKKIYVKIVAFPFSRSKSERDATHIKLKPLQVFLNIIFLFEYQKIMFILLVLCRHLAGQEV